MAAARLGDVPIPRIAEPYEITRLVLFVASDEASFSIGSEFIVDDYFSWLRPIPANGLQDRRPSRPTNDPAAKGK